ASPSEFDKLGTAVMAAAAPLEGVAGGHEELVVWVVAPDRQVVAPALLSWTVRARDRRDVVGGPGQEADRVRREGVVAAEHIRDADLAVGVAVQRRVLNGEAAIPEVDVVEH